MSLQLRVGLVTIGFALKCSMNASAAGAQQKLLTSEQRHIVDTVSTFFTAFRTNDTSKFGSVIAPAFCRNRRAVGRSSSCTALVSQRSLRRTANELRGREVVECSPGLRAISAADPTLSHLKGAQ
jgi:hypothetical protein